MRRFTSLAHFFKATRERQEDFAARMGVTQSTVSRWVNGHALPVGEQLLKLSRESRVKVEDLVTSRAGDAGSGAEGAQS